MARALLYLRVMSLVGRVKSRLQRLKQPKYLAGSVVGVAYLYLTFLRRVQVSHAAHPPASRGPVMSPEALTFVPELGAIVLLVVLIANWAVPRNASLAFSEAEIAFLFPAPVTRRMLLHYRLLGSQFGVAVTALIFTVVFGRGQGLGGSLWFHAIGWWLILATLNLHLTGTAFVYSKFLNRSITSSRRRATTIAGAGVAVCGLALWGWSVMRWPQQADFGSGSAFTSYLTSQLHTGPLPWLLAIPKLLIAPYFASSGSALLRALGPALIVLVANYVWVVHTEVSFEEASIARATKRAARIQATRQGDWRGQAVTRKAQRPPFELRDAARPEMAFLWKNLLSTSPLFRPRVALVMVAIVLIGAEFLVLRPQSEPIRLIAASMFGVLLAMTVLFGPMVARQDLRADLPNADILKSYPLRGWQIVLGELLTPLSILSGLIWIGLLAEVLLWPSDKLIWLNGSLRAVAALGLALMAPPFVAIQLLVPNAAAVVFPAWTQSVGRTERGIEVLGQRIIFVAGQLLVTAIAAIPAAASAALVFFLAQWLAGLLAAAVLAVVTVFLLLSLEVWLGVRWLGQRFEHFDLSSELRP
jgi:ABC-2 type transport system permease protein